jgi:hypothetical protein
VPLAVMVCKPAPFRVRVPELSLNVPELVKLLVKLNVFPAAGALNVAPDATDKVPPIDRSFDPEVMVPAVFVKLFETIVFPLNDKTPLLYAEAGGVNSEVHLATPIEYLNSSI